MVDESPQLAAIENVANEAISLAGSIVAAGASTRPDKNTAKVSQLKLELERIKEQAATKKRNDQSKQANVLKVEFNIIPRDLRGSDSVMDKRACTTG